jgi:p-methyltransferase
MSAESRLDCVTIGYNEPPFEVYEGFLSRYGEDSEAYRDLKFSFVDIEGKKLNYIDLLNHVYGSVNGASIDSTASHKFKACDIPNLAAAYLTHYLRKRGFEAHYINLFQYEKDRLAQYLAQDPLCVAITTTFYVVNFPIHEMVKFIRERNEKVKIIIGGPLIANHARNNQGDEFKAALADLGADIYVIESQGESTLAKLVSCLKNGESLSAVPNIAYFDDDVLIRTPVLAENTILDEEFIEWGVLADEDLGTTLQTRTARSCAFKCSFCNYPTRAGKLTLASVDSVEQELDSMRDLGYVKNVVFIDDTFNVPLTRFKDICRLMIKKNYKFNWFSYFRCSNSDEEAIELMAESGCRGVFLGVESGSPRILTNMNKAATVEKYVKGIEMLRQHNIITFASLIFGFPGETAETVGETINFITSTKPDYYRIQLWYCEPGTPIAFQKEKYGIQGEGFVWSHDTMDSLEAMDHIERAFLTIKESIWLPQWSFDFWTIPYLLGKGVSQSQFKELMASAQKLLSLEIAAVAGSEKKSLQRAYIQGLIDRIKGWNKAA